MAFGLDSQRARVRLTWTGRACLHVAQELDATLRGMSLLEYSGEPKVSYRISGTGQVLHRVNVD